MKPILSRLILVIGLIATSQTFAQGPTGLSDEALDSLVNNAMQAFDVPGIAVGIVKDGKLVFAKGYGVRNIGTGAPVDADTLFGIASNTKGITATALGLLVDEGKLDWDDKVTRYIPEFELYDPWVTREFTIRDLLTHRSGLPLGAGDLMWWPTGQFTPDEVLAGMKYLKPVTSFRSTYAYNNMLYVVAGELIPRVTGQSWGDFVQSRILDRLGMQSCKTLRDRAGNIENIAVPHTVVEGKMSAMHVADDDFKTAEAAAGIVCNITGLAKWIAMHLNEGKMADGTVLISEKNHDEIWSVQTVQQVSKQRYEDSRTHFRGYGLGYGLDDYHGYKRVSHGGGLPGMVTLITMIPELELGVVVLTNQQAGGAMRAITETILRSYMQVEQKDWVIIFQERGKKFADRMDKLEKRIWQTADKSGPPPLAISAYVGTYHDPWRGDVTIKKDGDRLTLAFSRSDLLIGPLHHYKNGIFIARWNDRAMFADAFVRFTLGYDGKITGMTMEAVLPNTDFSFDFHHLNFEKSLTDK